MKTYCNKCKKALDEGDNFCRYCGSSDIIIEYQDELRIKPQFEIEGDILRKYNNKQEGKRLYEQFIDIFDRSLDWHSTFNMFSEYDFYKAIEKYSTSNKPEVESWKKETSLVLPSSIKQLIGYKKYPNYLKNTTCNPVFNRCFIYSLSIPSSITKINMDAWESAYIGFLDVDIIPVSTEYDRVLGGYIYQLKINEGCSELNYKNFNIKGRINNIIFPHSLKRIKFVPSLAQIPNLVIPGSLDEFDLRSLINRGYGFSDVSFEGTKARFKAISKNSLDIINKTGYCESYFAFGLNAYSFYSHTFKYSSIKCSDGDVSFGATNLDKFNKEWVAKLFFED